MLVSRTEQERCSFCLGSYALGFPEIYYFLRELGDLLLVQRADFVHFGVGVPLCLLLLLFLFSEQLEEHIMPPLEFGCSLRECRRARGQRLEFGVEGTAERFRDDDDVDPYAFTAEIRRILNAVR